MKTHLFLDLLNLLSVLVEDMLADKVRPLELLARERTEPLVLACNTRLAVYTGYTFRKSATCPAPACWP